MDFNKPYLLTPEGVNRLQNELTHLKTTKREEVAARLERALDDGQDDEFVDNAELESARNDQSFIEGRIIEIDYMLKNHELIEDVSDRSKVRIGSHVTVMEVGFDEKERYHLVGAAEANPAEGRISNESPLGSALLGAKLKQTVQFEAPGGSIEFKVIKIE
ncbi:MAG: transcription elongation factor GreA [Candidatus Promineifilaceae bacterium]